MTNAISLSPSDESGYYWRSIAKFDPMRVDGAIDDLKNATTRQNNDAYRFWRAVCLSEYRPDDKTLVDVNELIKSHPDNAALLKLHADLCFRKRNWNQAITDLSSCIANKFEFSDSLALRALAYKKANRADLAEKDWRAVRANGGRIECKDDRLSQL